MIVFYSSAKVRKWVCQHGIHQCWICWFSWFCHDLENVVLVSWHFPDILEIFWKSREICVCLAQEREMYYIQLMELSLLLLQLLVKYSFSFTHIIIQFSFIQCHIKEFIVLSLMCLSGVCFFNLLKYHWLDIDLLLSKKSLSEARNPTKNLSLNQSWHSHSLHFMQSYYCKKNVFTASFLYPWINKELKCKQHKGFM